MLQSHKTHLNFARIFIAACFSLTFAAFEPLQSRADSEAAPTVVPNKKNPLDDILNNFNSGGFTTETDVISQKPIPLDHSVAALQRHIAACSAHSKELKEQLRQRSLRRYSQPSAPVQNAEGEMRSKLNAYEQLLTNKGSLVDRARDMREKCTAAGLAKSELDRTQVRKCDEMCRKLDDAAETLEDGRHDLDVAYHTMVNVGESSSTSSSQSLPNVFDKNVMTR